MKRGCAILFTCAVLVLTGRIHAEERLPRVIDSHALSILQDAAIPGRYSVNKLFDGDPRTSWVEGAAGDGIGEKVRVTLDPPAERISYIQILPGYFDPNWWKENNRIRQLKVTLSDETGKKSVYSPLFSDVMRPQGFHIEKQSISQWEIEIVSVYSGDTWADSCIAEVGLYRSGAWEEYSLPTEKVPILTAPQAEEHTLPAGPNVEIDETGWWLNEASQFNRWHWQFAPDGSFICYRMRDPGSAEIFRGAEKVEHLYILGMWHYNPESRKLSLTAFYRTGQKGSGDYVTESPDTIGPGPFIPYFTEHIPWYEWRERSMSIDWSDFSTHLGEVKD